MTDEDPLPLPRVGAPRKPIPSLRRMQERIGEHTFAVTADAHALLDAAAKAGSMREQVQLVERLLSKHWIEGWKAALRP